MYKCSDINSVMKGRVGPRILNIVIEIVINNLTKNK